MHDPKFPRLCGVTSGSIFKLNTLCLAPAPRGGLPSPYYGKRTLKCTGTLSTLPAAAAHPPLGRAPPCGPRNNLQLQAPPTRSTYTGLHSMAAEFLAIVVRFSLLHFIERGPPGGVSHAYALPQPHVLFCMRYSVVNFSTNVSQYA